MARSLAYLLCFCSGLAGLSYEVVWLRLLAAVLGNSAYATAAVLAAVMAGMGLGALAAGRLSDHRAPLRLYGFVAVALGLTALAVPTLIQAAGSAATPLLAAVGPGLAGGLARFLLAGLVVLVPASLMGATVPLLVRFVELQARSGPDPVGPATAVIYGLNTAGAALGSALTGYVLLGAWGTARTSATAAGVDIAVGLAALALSLAVEGKTAPRGAAVQGRAAAAALPPGVVLALAFASGACVLGLEAVWTRILRIVFGHDVHAFASMLSAVLVGLAAGSAGYRLLPRRARGSGALVPALFTLVGTTALLSLALAGRAYLARGEDVLHLSSALPFSRAHELGLWLQVTFAGICVLLPATFSGALLPALAASYRAPRPGAAAAPGGGHRVGALVAANTFGAVAGSLAAPLLAVPAIGIQRTVVALAALSVAAACLAIAASRATRALALAGSAAAIAALALSALALPRELPRAALSRKIGPAHLSYLLYEEGRTGTVAVVQNRLNGERQLFINGVNEVTTRLVHDQSFKLLGHLGLLLHPEPDRVVVICLGAGISAGAVATHDVSTLRVVDLERSVIRAAALFPRLNNRLLSDPRLDLVVDDGRNHLRVASEPYDVIVVDSTHPRAVDSWILYTREFYELARSRLAEEGYLVQWLPLHGLTVDEFRIIVHTFVETFPEGSLWVNAGFESYGEAAYALLLGPRGDGTLDLERLAEALSNEAVRRDLDPWGLFTVAEVLECFVAGPDALRRWVGHLPVNTDDLPWTQFVTRFSRSAIMSSERLLEVREPVTAHLSVEPDPALAADLRRRYDAQGFLLAGRLDRAIEVCGPSCEKPPMYADEVAEGQPYFLALRELYLDDPGRLLEIAASLAALGHAGSAVSTLELAVDRERRDPRLWMNLGVARMDAGDAPGAVEALRSALALQPGLALARVDLGLALLRLGRVQEAVPELREALRAEPDLAAAHATMGYALLHGTEEQDLAELHLRRALELDPRNREARISLARLFLRAGRDEAAVGELRTARRLFPHDGDVLFSLGVALARTGRTAGAERALEAATRVEPRDLEAAASLRALRARREPRAPAEPDPLEPATEPDPPEPATEPVPPAPADE